jgi:class 3 adenylate cyclase
MLRVTGRQGGGGGSAGESDQAGSLGGDAIGALTETWRRWGHDIGFGIGIAHGFATLGTIGFEGRFDYAAIGTVSNVASRLCDEAKPGQILISPRVLTKVENAVQVKLVGEFDLRLGGLSRLTTFFLRRRNA